jgi:hypothetical protein
MFERSENVTDGRASASSPDVDGCGAQPHRNRDSG